MAGRQDHEHRPELGRPAQRRRTRRAIVEAATELRRTGQELTVDTVAALADVSRRTVYLYFPTLDQLQLDAALGALSEVETARQESSAAAPAPSAAADPAGSVAALVRAVLAQAPETLPLGRQILRLTVDAPDTRTGDPGPRRGYRRVGWIEAALEGLRPELSEEQHDRLVSVLAVLIGFEAMVVMRDVRGADAAAEERAITWAARTLVDAIVAEAKTGRGSGPRGQAGP